MSPAGILLRLAAAGVAVRRDGRDLVLGGPVSSLPAAVLAEARRHRLAIFRALADPGRAGREVWAEALAEVAGRWNVAWAGAGPSDPWLPVDEDLDLHARVREALRSGDLRAALEAAAAWRREWLELLDVEAARLEKGAP
ncbi:MAG: hypothetical protein JXA90_10515 [Planctomycetes bacterium]|nr:hypothetical protein [Planctomycetota bacterium]